MGMHGVGLVVLAGKTSDARSTRERGRREETLGACACKPSIRHRVPRDT